MSFTDLGVNKNNGTLPRQTNSSSISKNTPSQSQNLDSIVVEIGESLTKFQVNSFSSYYYYHYSLSFFLLLFD